MNFLLNCPISSFPSDNDLDSMPRRERINIKKVIKNDALVLCTEWLQKNRIKSNSLKKSTPLFRAPVVVILTVYLKRGTTRDMPNFSTKHFIDQLVKMGIIADDSEKFLIEERVRFGGYVEKHSCCTFQISEIGENDEFS